MGESATRSGDEVGKSKSTVPAKDAPGMGHTQTLNFEKSGIIGVQGRLSG